MSYSVRLNSARYAETGEGFGHRFLTPTYNLSAIFDYAITGERLPSPGVSEMERVLFRKEVERPRGLCVLEGRKVSDSIPMIKNAIARMQDPALRDAFIALEPENKWGTLPGAIECMQEMLSAAERSVADGYDEVWSVE